MNPITYSVLENGKTTHVNALLTPPSSPLSTLHSRSATTMRILSRAAMPLRNAVGGRNNTLLLRNVTKLLLITRRRN